ncbi:hypothetical protein [Flammeovirga sp. SJP92]|uniref:hypothetical protein n=1 Tax=Flammeovirga sp. SJP92 TaxID=1775430 RepID=UPI0012FC7AC8|nr:hypothetical protein [Flammeovirga sp. SJP92]
MMRKKIIYLFVLFNLLGCSSTVDIYIKSRYEDDTWGGMRLDKQLNKKSTKESYLNCAYEFISYDTPNVNFDSEKDSVFEIYYTVKNVNLSSIIEPSDVEYVGRDRIIIISKNDTLRINSKVGATMNGKNFRLSHKGKQFLFNCMPRELQFNWNLEDNYDGIYPALFKKE